MLGYLIGIYIFTKGCYDEKTKAYEADHSDPADRDIACHHRIYYLFCSERKPVILDVTVFEDFICPVYWIFILLSDFFQIFFDIFLISIFRWFIKRCSKKLIWKILLFYIMIWIIMRIFISDSMS